MFTSLSQYMCDTLIPTHAQAHIMASYSYIHTKATQLLVLPAAEVGLSLRIKLLFVSVGGRSSVDVSYVQYTYIHMYTWMGILGQWHSVKWLIVGHSAETYQLFIPVSCTLIKQPLKIYWLALFSINLLFFESGYVYYYHNYVCMNYIVEPS